MTYVPHVYVILPVGPDHGAIVKVAFVKTIKEMNSPLRIEMTDEKPGPSLEELPTETAHDVARLLHETLEMDREFRRVPSDANEDGDDTATDIFHHPGMGANDHEGDAAALVDATAMAKRYEKTVHWYENLHEALQLSLKLCPVGCRPQWRHREVLSHQGDDICQTCGGCGYVEVSSDGKWAKTTKRFINSGGSVNASAYDSDFTQPKMPGSEAFEKPDTSAL